MFQVLCFLFLKLMPIDERVPDISKHRGLRQNRAESAKVHDHLFLHVLWSDIFLHILLNQSIDLFSKLSIKPEVGLEPIHIEYRQNIIIVPI